MNTVGPAGKLTPEITETFVKAFKSGYSNVVACAYAGITQGTFYFWLQKAKTANDDPENNPELQKYAEFEREILKAKAEHLAECQDRINNAMKIPDNWQAAAWSLERRDPAEYSLKRPRRLERFGEALKLFKAKEMSYSELTHVIQEMMANAEISIEEGEILTNSVAKSAGVEEVTELKAILERLTAQVKS